MSQTSDGVDGTAEAVDGTVEVVEVDILVVGAGPVGLYAAYYAGQRGLSVALMDSLSEPGGQISAMYPEKPIFDVAGFPEVRGRDLVAGLVTQAGAFGPRYLLDQQAVGLRTEDGAPVVTSSTGTQVRCGAVVVTAGLGAFSPRPLPAGAGWEERGLAYFVPSLAEYADADVVVVGGGDSAADWALTLHPLAASVTMVHRSDRFRAHHATLEAVRALDIEIIVHSQVTQLRGSAWVTEVEVTDRRDGQARVLRADRVVAALGFTTDLGPLTSWGMAMTGRHITVDTTMATSVPRLFAAGDVADYPGKVRLISVGFGEAATAVNNAAVAIDPSARLFPGHSSDMKEPVGGSPAAREALPTAWP